jgi:hypothetical protein
MDKKTKTRRQEEYPTVEQSIHSLLDNDDYDGWVKKRQLTKERYPVEGHDPVRYAWAKLRYDIRKQLEATDYTQLPDYTGSQEDRKMYREYRQFLRDLPKTYNNKSVLKAKVPTFKEMYVG